MKRLLLISNTNTAFISGDLCDFGIPVQLIESHRNTRGYLVLETKIDFECLQITSTLDIQLMEWVDNHGI